MEAKWPPVVVVHVRLPKELIKELDHLGVDSGEFRPAVMERLLRAGLLALKDLAAEARSPNA